MYFKHHIVSESHPK